jgi:hypothetical protein
MDLRVAILLLLALNALGLCIHLVALRRQRLLRYVSRGMNKSVAALCLSGTALYVQVALQGSGARDGIRLALLAVYPVVLTLLFRTRLKDRWLLPLTLSVAGLGLLTLLSTEILGPNFTTAYSLGLGGFAQPGILGALHGIYILSVLALLIWRKISWNAKHEPHIVQSLQWQFLVLINAFVRTTATALIIALNPPTASAWISNIGILVLASFAVDLAVLFTYGTNRSVFFLSEHGIALTHRWNPQIERIICHLERPEAFSNTRYSLNDAGTELGLRNLDVTTTIHRDLGVTFKQLLFHIRYAHYRSLTQSHPERSKIERLHQSGFKSYASFHLAHKANP